MTQDKGASASADRATAVEPVPVSPLRDGIPSAALLDEIIAHLGAAISQSIPTDNQIIMAHVQAARDLAIIVRRFGRAQ